MYHLYESRDIYLEELDYCELTEELRAWDFIRELKKINAMNMLVVVTLRLFSALFNGFF